MNESLHLTNITYFQGTLNIRIDLCIHPTTMQLPHLAFSIAIPTHLLYSESLAGIAKLEKSLSSCQQYQYKYRIIRSIQLNKKSCSLSNNPSPFSSLSILASFHVFSSSSTI